jgi:hypothetical protein
MVTDIGSIIASANRWYTGLIDMRYVTKKNALVLAVGIVLGLLLVGLWRFISYDPHNTHYHANFGLYINGKRDQFKSFTYYEEVSSCSVHNDANPKIGVHMHDNVSDVVHVHRPAMTWGQFFANLGYTLGDSLIKNDQQVYIDGVDNNHLQFILNGQPTTNIANRVIASEDRLLIDYGNDDQATLKQRYNSISTSAKHYNETKDPAACSGDSEATPVNRLRYAVGIEPKSH